VDFDVVTELVFRDAEHKDAWFGKVAGRAEEVVADEARFIDRSKTRFTEVTECVTNDG